VPVFDTSALPANAWITAAQVRLTCVDIKNPRGADICLTPATNVALPLVPIGYSKLLDTPTIIASKPIADIIYEVPYWLTLSEEGLDAITKAGITKLGLRINFEIQKNGCGVDIEYCKNITQDHPYVGWRPLIRITYRLPA